MPTSTATPDFRSSVSGAGGPLDLKGAGTHPDRHQIVLEPSPRRVRVVIGGRTVADSTAIRLLHETGRIPVYYFPRADVDMDRLRDEQDGDVDPHRGPTRVWAVEAGDRRAAGAAWSHPQAPAGSPDLSGLVAFEWDRMDHWFEEDEEVFVHARDPYKRVDALVSSRHVEVRIDGELVADSHHPALLFETGLPTRFYLPKLDVRLDLLRHSDTASACPYKGQASYWTVCVNGTARTDIAWEYHTPLPGVSAIADHICFYNERVDLVVDGVAQPRPDSPWS